MRNRTAFAALVLAAALGAPEPALAAEPSAAPPYVVAGTHHVVVAVVWDEAAIRRALPAGVEPVPAMTGAINLYQADRGYGIGPYQGVYFWVDVEGFDSPSGVKGRWMLAGAYSEGTAAAFGEHFRLPVRVGGSRLVATDGGLRAVGEAAGRDVVTVDVRRRDEPCAEAAVALFYPSPAGLIEIPFVGTMCAADAVRVAVQAPPGDPFAAFVPVEVLGATEITDGAFSLSRAMPERRASR